MAIFHHFSKLIGFNFRGEIDIDALPDAEGFHGGGGTGSTDGNLSTERPASVTTPNSMPPLPPLVPTTSDQLHSMQKYYEDTMKRYMNDLQASSHNANSSSNSTSDASPGLGDSNVSPFHSNISKLVVLLVLKLKLNIGKKERFI